MSAQAIKLTAKALEEIAAITSEPGGAEAPLSRIQEITRKARGRVE